MRIIAGHWRSRHLCAPNNFVTRPVPDRVKESIFNKLGSYYGCPGELPAIHVADAFSGSGSMGLEALSRGAESCTFFERDPEAISALKLNLSALDVGTAASVVRGDAWRKAVARSDGGPLDLILLDPPFRDSSDPSESGAVHRYLSKMSNLGDASLLIVLHHEVSVAPFVLPGDRWTVLDERRFGRNVVTFFER